MSSKLRKKEVRRYKKIARLENFKMCRLKTIKQIHFLDIERENLSLKISHLKSTSSKTEKIAKLQTEFDAVTVKIYNSKSKLQEYERLLRIPNEIS